MKQYARIMFDKNGGNRRCVVIKAENVVDAIDMLDAVEHGESVSFEYKEWKMKSGEKVPPYVELA